MDFVDVVTVPSQVYNRTHNVNVVLNVNKIKVFYFTEPRERKRNLKKKVRMVSLLYPPSRKWDLPFWLIRMVGQRCGARANVTCSEYCSEKITVSMQRCWWELLQVAHRLWRAPDRPQGTCACTCLRCDVCSQVVTPKLILCEIFINKHFIPAKAVGSMS